MVVNSRCRHHTISGRHLSSKSPPSFWLSPYSVTLFLNPPSSRPERRTRDRRSTEHNVKSQPNGARAQSVTNTRRQVQPTGCSQPAGTGSSDAQSTVQENKPLVRAAGLSTANRGKRSREQGTLYTPPGLHQNCHRHRVHTERSGRRGKQEKKRQRAPLDQS